MALFGNWQEADLRSCIKMVEDALKALGHVLDDSRLETESQLPAWRVKKGSAELRVELVARGDGNVIRVTAPVVRFTDAADQRKLFKRLLELNCTEVAGAAFGVRDHDVVLYAVRTTLDLDPSEVLDTLRRTQDDADRYDDLLCAEIGDGVTRFR